MFTCPVSRGGLTVLQRFKREATTWGQLHHPYILPLYGCKVDDPSGLVSPVCSLGNLPAFFRTNPGCDYLKKLELVRRSDSLPAFVLADISLW